MIQVVSITYSINVKKTNKIVKQWLLYVCIFYIWWMMVKEIPNFQLETKSVYYYTKDVRRTKNFNVLSVSSETKEKRGDRWNRRKDVCK